MLPSSTKKKLAPKVNTTTPLKKEVAEGLLNLSSQAECEDYDWKSEALTLRTKNDTLVRELYQAHQQLQEQSNLYKRLQETVSIIKLGEMSTPRTSDSEEMHFSGPSSPLAPVPSDFKLTIIEQPPTQAIYQRILKPFPTVSVSGIPENARQNLYVSVTLVKKMATADGFTKCGGEPLEGDTRNLVPVASLTDDSVVVFRKLKILTTSSQQGGADFVLKFSLQRMSRNVLGQNVFEELGVPSVFSSAISVFSHTLYLKPKQLSNLTGLRQSKVKTKATDDAVTIKRKIEE